MPNDSLPPPQPSCRDSYRDEKTFRLLAENTTDIVILSDLDTTRRYVSPAVRTVLGYEPEELIGTTPWGFVHPDDMPAFRIVVESLSQARVPRATASQRYRHKNGSWVWIEASFALTYHDGKADGCVCTLRDVSDRKRIEDALRISEERLALALDSGGDGVWDCNFATGEAQIAGRWWIILGYELCDVEPSILGWHGLTHPDDADRVRRCFLDHLHGRSPAIECEYRIRSKDGGYVWTLARGRVVSRDGQGNAVRIVGTYMDITARKEADLRLAHLALHDPLTGLANRAHYHDRLARHFDEGRAFALLVCDLDRFKSINDMFGHLAGDDLLNEVALRLKAAARPGDLVARLGGDEFAIVLDDVRDVGPADEIAHRVIEAISAPILVRDQAVRVGISIGIAFSTRDGEDTDRISQNADTAMYAAKRSGRNALMRFEPGMDEIVSQRLLLEGDLHDAVRRGGFTLYYQPIIHLRDASLKGFEVLLRWQHPTRGAVPPAEFIPLAEQSGLIVGLGEWALREACLEAARWPDQLRIAVNVSAVQFQRPGLEQVVVSALATSGLAPSRLELEITESVMIHDVDHVVECLDRLRAIGVTIGLDDFGTGYSSLAYLRRFAFDNIKLDRSFVKDLADPATEAVVSAVVGLGRRVGATITAEGVETEEELRRVRARGCDAVQGYLFSKPLPLREARMLAARSRRDELLARAG